MKKIGLVAGSGQFPVIFAKAMLSQCFSVYTAAYLKEASPLLLGNSTKLEWMHPGQINQLIKFFKENEVENIVMLGSIKKTKLFKDIKPDIKAISIIAKVKTTHDDTIMRAFAKYLKKTGIIVKSSTVFMPELLAKSGIWTKRKPSHSERKNIEIGLRVAKEIGKMDIGQSVIVGQASVLAVEAIDGTDATIKRGGSLSSKKAVLVKVCKPNQDKRFDMPAVGLKTVKTMHQHNISALAIESETTIVFDQTKMIEEADKHNITIICL